MSGAAHGELRPTFTSVTANFAASLARWMTVAVRLQRAGAR